jgi:hypothetical protein
VIAELDEVLVAVIDLMAKNGGSEWKTEWLESRRVMLASPIEESDKKAILRDIHHNIPGMNGLVDEHLRPPEGSKQDEARVNARLLALADLLYDLTKR